MPKTRGSLKSHSSTRSTPIRPSKKPPQEQPPSDSSDSEVIIGMRGDKIQVFVQVSSEDSSQEDSDDDEFIIFQGNVKHEDVQEIEVVYQGWSSEEEDDDDLLFFDPHALKKHANTPTTKPSKSPLQQEPSPLQSVNQTSTTEPVSFDIKKTKMGENGELITTTKSLVFKNLKSAPKKSREDSLQKTTHSRFASPLPTSLASNSHSIVGSSRIPPQLPIPTSAHAKTTMATRSSAPNRPASTTPSNLVSQIMKTPLNMNSLTAKAINSTLLLLSELRKRDPVGTALDPATLNARIKAAAQAAVASTTASATNAYHRNSATGSARVQFFQKKIHNNQDLEFPKNIEEFTAIFNSQTAVAAALSASKKKAPAPEPMTLDDVLDTHRLDAELLHRSSEVTVTRSGPRASLPSSDSDHKLTSFRRSQRRAARPLTPSKKEVSKALRKAGAKRLKKMETTLGAWLPDWLSPDMKPCSVPGPASGPASGLDLGVPPLHLSHEYDNLGTFLLLEQVQDNHE